MKNYDDEIQKKITVVFSIQLTAWMETIWNIGDRRNSSDFKRLKVGEKIIIEREMKKWRSVAEVLGDCTTVNGR